MKEVNFCVFQRMNTEGQERTGIEVLRQQVVVMVADGVEQPKEQSDLVVL